MRRNFKLLTLFAVKRDWDIIREILQKTEELEPNYLLTLDVFNSDNAYDISYNVKLLGQAGLLVVEMSEVLNHDPKQFWISSLTWEGHEFFDAIKSESIWKKTKDKIIEKGGTMTFDVVKAVALGLIKTSLGL